MSRPPPATKPLSRKRTQSVDLDDGPSTKKPKALAPSQSFVVPLAAMAPNDSTLAGPHTPVAIDFNETIVFQYVDVRQHEHNSDVGLLFGVTEAAVRVLVHITNISTIPGQHNSAVENFLGHYNIKAMSWLELLPGEYHPVDDAARLSHNQTEVAIPYGAICVPKQAPQKEAALRILSFDIETRIRADMAFTQYHETAELPVIQIGNFVQINGDETQSYRIIFTLNSCADIENAEVNSFPDEESMLLAWRDFVVNCDPELITGHNIARFDFVYLLLRAEVLGLSGFACLGRLKDLNAIALKVSHHARRLWGDAPVLAGRLQLDTYQYIEERNYRHFKGVSGKSCTLNNVCGEFLKGSKKEDINFKQINGLQDGDEHTRRQLAVYCLKDSHLPLQLLFCDGLKCLKEAVEAARESQDVHLPFSDFLRMGRNQPNH
ncbi:ribonuclease H-like domain-containing protein [Mycena filopes]|nr:ribonuclease H-like domain-containing protein [Mycena filopes]